MQLDRSHSPVIWRYYHGFVGGLREQVPQVSPVASNTGTSFCCYLHVRDECILWQSVQCLTVPTHMRLTVAN